MHLVLQHQQQQHQISSDALGLTVCVATTSVRLHGLPHTCTFQGSSAHLRAE